jgi:hypothetical protein
MGECAIMNLAVHPEVPCPYGPHRPLHWRPHSRASRAAHPTPGASDCVRCGEQVSYHQIHREGVRTATRQPHVACVLKGGRNITGSRRGKSFRRTSWRTRKRATR